MRVHRWCQMTALMVTIFFDDNKKQREESGRTLRANTSQWLTKRKVITDISPGDSSPQESPQVWQVVCHNTFLIITIYFSSRPVQISCWLLLLMMLLALIGACSDEKQELYIKQFKLCSWLSLENACPLFEGLLPTVSFIRSRRFAFV